MDWKNLGQRVAVAVVFIPMILYLSWIGGLGFMLLIEAIVLLGLVEFYKLARNKRMRPNRVLGLMAGAAVAPLIYFQSAASLWMVFIALVVAVVAVELFQKPEEGGSPLQNVAATIFGVAYVAGLLTFLLMLREIPHAIGANYASAGTWVVMIFLTIWICDTAAYFVGLYFGRRKLYERVSPKKTIEGAVGGFVFAILTAIVCQQTFVTELQTRDALVIGVIVGIFGQMSDLVESLFKRDAGVKDSSHLIPGHGGMLDRFDSEMLVAPLVYFYLLVMGV